MGIRHNNTLDNVLLEGNELPLGLLNGFGSIGRYSPKRIHRTIQFNDDFINTMILPKGTLLFRSIEDKYNEDETKGFLINDQRYMYPYLNVFFYPYPFVADMMNFYTSQSGRFLVFEITEDVEVVMGVSPSHNKRSNRYFSSYLTSCDKIDDSVVKGKSYDPCFTKEFAQENPTLSGLFCLANVDANQLISISHLYMYFAKYRSLMYDHAMDHNKNKNNNTRGNNYDSVSIGVPEIVLHPLKNRFDLASENIYKLVHDVSHTNFRYDKAWKLVEASLAANGPWTIDLATRMYIHYESASDEVKARCVPPEDPYKLHWLNHSYDI